MSADPKRLPNPPGADTLHLAAIEVMRTRASFTGHLFLRSNLATQAGLLRARLADPAAQPEAVQAQALKVAAAALRIFEEWGRA